MSERMFAAKRAVSRLNAEGVANRVVGTNDGINMILKKVLAADIDPGGAVSRILSVGAGGIVGWNQLTAAMIPAQIITGGAIGAGMHIAPGTIVGAQAGANSNIGAETITGANIQNGTLTNSDLAAQTLRGGVDGASGRVAPGTLNYLDLASGSAVVVQASGVFSQGHTNPPWTWLNGGAQVTVNPVAGAYVVVGMIGYVINTVANATNYWGIGQNTNTSQTGLGLLGNIGAANTVTPFCHFVPYGFAGNATYYGVGGTNTGTATYTGQMISLEFRR